MITELTDQQIVDQLEAGERTLRTFDIEIWEIRRKLEDLRAEQIRRTCCLEPVQLEVEAMPAPVRKARQAWRKKPPVSTCRGGCGRKRGTWSTSWICRFCLLADREAAPESFRATRQRLQGQSLEVGVDPDTGRVTA